MKNTLIILALLCSLSAQAQFYPGRHFPAPCAELPNIDHIPAPRKMAQSTAYTVTRTKIAGWSLAAIGGAVDGILEGYTFDGRRSFERKYGVKPISYFGSQSWRTAYNDNNPDNGFKSPYRELVGARDFYHHADDLRKIGYVSGGMVIGIGGRVNTKWWHYAIDFGMGVLISGSAKAAGMAWVRN